LICTRRRRTDDQQTHPTRACRRLAAGLAQYWPSRSVDRCIGQDDRHYESIGLTRPSGRTFANYRLYNDADVHRLRFIKRSRSLGFSIRQIESLLALWDNPQRASAEVKQLARSHAAELAEKIRELQAMQRTLERLAKQCHGDHRPSCPILDDLASSH